MHPCPVSGRPATTATAPVVLDSFNVLDEVFDVVNGFDRGHGIGRRYVLRVLGVSLVFVGWRAPFTLLKNVGLELS